MDKEAARQIASQLARPTGEGGLKITTAMNTLNAFITSRALEALAPTRGEHVLEIGPGNGLLSRSTVMELGDGGRYLGFEYNEDIAAVARETFSDADASVEVRSGDFMAHAPEPERFDALFAVNVIYFFDDLAGFFARCREWLRPGGRLTVGVRSMEALRGLPFIEHGFHLRSLDELLCTLYRAGFGPVQARYFDEGTTTLGDLEVLVDSIIVSATRT